MIEIVLFLLVAVLWAASWPAMYRLMEYQRRQRFTSAPVFTGLMLLFGFQVYGAVGLALAAHFLFGWAP